MNTSHTILSEGIWREFHRVSGQPPNLEPGKYTIAIVCYKSDQVGTWYPGTVNEGLPGSEEAVVYASEELAQLGHRVTIFAHPPLWASCTLPLANPRWTSVDEFDQTTEQFQIGLAWRRYDFDTLRKHCSRVFFWPHDTPRPNLYLPSVPDGIFYLSEHHRRQFRQHSYFLDTPYVIAGNGLLPRHFSKSPTRNPLSCGYFSNYARGLWTLLSLWSIVLSVFPSATLDIYYGRQTWGILSVEQMDMLVKLIEKYPNSVFEHGNVGHTELASAMSHTSVLAYPCNTETETFCITAIKAQAAGMIPVVPAIGALPEVLHPDLPRFLPYNPSEYLTQLMSVLQRCQDTSVDTEREKYREFGLQFTWRRVVERWLELIRQIT